MKNVIDYGASIPLEWLKNTRTYQVMDKLITTNSIDRDDADWLTHWVNHNGYCPDGVVYFGWKFEFSRFMARFQVIPESSNDPPKLAFGFDEESVRKSFKADIVENFTVKAI